MAYNGIFGELELPYPDTTGPWEDGSVQRMPRSNEDWLRGFGNINWAHDKHQRAVTAEIRVRPAAERQVPPGFGGDAVRGSVNVTLPPGLRYFRKNPATGSEEELAGTFSCNPDEACQIVGHTAVAGGAFA